MRMGLEGRRVLVTGASGFIGRLLCTALTRRGCDVLALLRRPAAGPWRSVVLAELGFGSISATSIEGVDTIFHLAGKAHVKARSAAEVREYETVHVHGTRSLLVAAREVGVRRFVLLSSVKAMGEGCKDIWDEDTPCVPQNAYGLTKLEAERVVLEKLPLECPVVLRPALVYGAGSKGNLELMIRAIRKSMFPRIAFPPNLRSMIHVEDVIQACLLAAERVEACGRTYILTDGREYSTAEVFDWICEALGKRPFLNIPYNLVKACAALGDAAEHCGIPSPLTSDRLAKLAESARYSNARICRELGFKPAWNLHEGVRQMVAVQEGS